MEVCGLLFEEKVPTADEVIGQTRLKLLKKYRNRIQARCINFCMSLLPMAHNSLTPRQPLLIHPPLKLRGPVDAYNRIHFVVGLGF